MYATIQHNPPVCNIFKIIFGTKTYTSWTIRKSASKKQKFLKQPKPIFFWKSLPSQVRISKLECNKHDGSWVGEKSEDSGNLTVPAGSNVICYEGELLIIYNFNPTKLRDLARIYRRTNIIVKGDCETSRIFPSCESHDEECRDVRDLFQIIAFNNCLQYLAEGHKFSCKAPAIFWYKICQR